MGPFPTPSGPKQEQNPKTVGGPSDGKETTPFPRSGAAQQKDEIQEGKGAKTHGQGLGRAEVVGRAENEEDGDREIKGHPASEPILDKVGLQAGCFLRPAFFPAFEFVQGRQGEEEKEKEQGADAHDPEKEIWLGRHGKDRRTVNPKQEKSGAPINREDPRREGRHPFHHQAAQQGANYVGGENGGRDEPTVRKIRNFTQGGATLRFPQERKVGKEEKIKKKGQEEEEKYFQDVFDPWHGAVSLP